jgi:hypothetical protein
VEIMTDLISAARDELINAESRVRALIETALSQQRYGDVARLAPIAEGLLSLSEVTCNGDGNLNTSQNWAEHDHGDQMKNSALLMAASEANQRYPRFERQGDRLAKIAWSKKDRREYEHRAPAELIFQIAEVFEQNTKRGKPFLMDDLLPFKSRSGDEIPSYQAYLALAWFRSLGLIEARGKDGYAVAVDDLHARAEHEWKDLPDALHH